MSEWQPIESAPKDGTAILVGKPNSAPKMVRWMISEAKGAPDGNWFVGGYDGYRLGCPPPTHWMSLPDPPDLIKKESSDDDRDKNRSLG